MLRLWMVIALAGALGAGCTNKEDGRPSLYAMPFSKVAASLENRGFEPIIEAEYLDGGWDVVARRGEEFVSLRVDASVGHFGRIRATEPPEDLPQIPPGAPKLSKVAAAVEAAGYAPILEAELEEDGWEIEALARVEVRTDLAGGILGAELDLEDDPGRDEDAP